MSTRPDKADVEAWMISLGFRKVRMEPVQDPAIDQWYRSDELLMSLSTKKAEFFYTIHHKALTSFRDEVLEQVIADDVPHIDGMHYMGGACYPECGSDEINDLKNEQRKAIQTISERYLI